MKRILALFLCLLMVLPLFSCSVKKSEETGTQEVKVENGSTPMKPTPTPDKETEDKKTQENQGPAVYDKVSDPLTPALLAALPVANASMTTDQLRDICVEYVKLSVSFQWVPDQSFDYEANQFDGTPVHYTEGKLYGGLPYVNLASGNLYRLFDYYDTETGVMNMKFLSKNLDLFGSACSGTASWGWHRVINSATLSWTYDLNQKNGLIKVGPYEYDAEIQRFGQDGAPGGKEIARNNGEQVMYASYAQTKKADCFVTDGHVRMNGASPVVVYKEDGVTIDGDKSYIVQVEQGLFTTSSYHKRVSRDGVEYMIQGNEGKNADGSDFYYTFKDLYSGGYLPHTFKEFLGLDPVEPGKVTRFDYEGGTFTAKSGELEGKMMETNYVISHTITTVTNESGAEVLRYTKHAMPHYRYSMELQDVIPVAALARYQTAGGHRIKVEVFLGNGETVLAYEGALA